MSNDGKEVENLKAVTSEVEKGIELGIKKVKEDFDIKNIDSKIKERE